jgi:hypothetical protein
MREYTFTNGNIEFVVNDINHLSAKKKAGKMQKDIVDSNPILKLIRIKDLN